MLIWKKELVFRFVFLLFFFHTVYCRLEKSCKIDIYWSLFLYIHLQISKQLFKSENNYLLSFCIVKIYINWCLIFLSVCFCWVSFLIIFQTFYFPTLLSLTFDWVTSDGYLMKTEFTPVVIICQTRLLTTPPSQSPSFLRPSICSLDDCWDCCIVPNKNR